MPFFSSFITETSPSTFCIHLKSAGWRQSHPSSGQHHDAERFRTRERQHEKVLDVAPCYRQVQTSGPCSRCCSVVYAAVLMQKAWVSWGQGWKPSSLAWLWAISTAGRDVSCCLWSPGTCIPPSKEPGCCCASVLLNKWSQKEPMQRDVHTGEKD